MPCGRRPPIFVSSAAGLALSTSGSANQAAVKRTALSQGGRLADCAWKQALASKESEEAFHRNLLVIGKMRSS